VADSGSLAWRNTQQAYALNGWAKDIAWFLRALSVEGAAEVELLGNVVITGEVYLPVVLRQE
jgi:hypothetical protein